MIVVCVQIEHTHPQCKTEIKNTAKTDFSKYKKDLSHHDQQTGPPGFATCTTCLPTRYHLFKAYCYQH